MILLSLSRTLARLEDTAPEEIASIPALMENAIVQPFSNEGRAIDSGLDTIVLPVIQTVVNRSVARAFQSSTFQTALNRAIQKYLAEPEVANKMAVRTIDTPVFMVIVV